MSFLINRIFPMPIGNFSGYDPLKNANMVQDCFGGNNAKVESKNQNGDGENAKGVNGQQQEQTITKSVWSNYDADQNANVNYNEANNNSLFTRADVQTTITAPLSADVQNQISKNVLKGFNIQEQFKTALAQFNFNSGSQVKEFKSEEEATKWANEQAKQLDSQTMEYAKQQSDIANNTIQNLYNKAIEEAVNKYQDSSFFDKQDFVQADNNNGDNPLNALKGDGDAHKATTFDSAQNTRTVTFENGKRTSYVNRTQSGNTSEVTTVNADGTKTVEITTKSDDGVTNVTTQKFDKKGRMRSSEHTVTKGDETNTTTDIYRRNGSRKSENSVYTNTVDGMKYTTTNNNEYRRNGSLKTTTHTGNDGITNVTDFRRNGVDTKHTETRIGNTTTETRDYSRSGKKETVNTYNGDGTRTKTTNRFLDAQRQTLDNSTARAYDSNGNLTSKTQTSYSSTGAQQTAKTYNADGTVKSKENSVYSSFDNDQNGKATYDDSSVKNRFESFKTSMTSSIKVDGLSNDAMTKLIKNANVDSDFETAVKGFSADSKAVLQKGDDPKAKQLGLNSKISMQIQRNAESALSGIKRNVETLGKAQVSMDKTIAEGGIAQYQSDGLRDLRMPAANDVFKSNTYTREKRKANQAETYKGCKTIDDVMKKAGIKDDDLKDTQYKDDFIKANPSVFAQNGKVLLNADWNKLDIIRKKA